MKTDVTLMALVSAAIAALCSYGAKLFIPIIVLTIVIVVDYLTGVAKAWVLHELSSKVGLIGFLKKIGFYVMIIVAGVIDWLIAYGLESANIDVRLPYFFAAIVCVWLIINELISILENVAAIGGPVPPFMQKLLKRLKNVVEDKADDGADDGKNEVDADDKRD